MADVIKIMLVEDALHYAEFYHVDVIILDLELHEGDGISFLEELKNSRQVLLV